MSAFYFILICLLLLLITEVVSIILKTTGLDIKKARFQVISIITHTGFTTKESELITQHPLRRKIAMLLMIISYVAQISLISVLLNVLLYTRSGVSLLVIFLFIVFVFAMFWSNFLFPRIEHLLENIITSKMIKNKNKKRVYDVLKLNEEYGIGEIVVNPESILHNISLEKSGLKERFIQVLTIDKGDYRVPFPNANYIFEEGDNVTVYGRIESIISLTTDNSELKIWH